ncbi:hypothetical protein R0131_08785 [Clostridium sp. AL.422]|uniref:hypothetical protein n=1 Tax=Clostridium TaxID=1485 RepID=UPI00293DC01D|nr:MULTISPECIES: hypothetical protein [unclassified Clostridium]MDV4150930.1 hypothetical protein [Clostridium sp. AL.422]
MSKCPFWSTKNERINCYSDCPMHAEINESELCPFKEFLVSGTKISLADNLNDDLFYSQDKYLKYDEDDRVINY